MNNAILWLDDSSSRDEQIVGGKAANLSRLSMLYRVPAGFCISAWALAEVDGTAMPDDLRSQILRAYRQLGIRIDREQPLVAVRSSAVSEDSATHSFAGQFETVLDVAGEEALLAAVLHACASAHAGHSTAYRQQHGLAAPRMAVLVQQMISADVSAVAFSINPVHGRRDEVIVEAVPNAGAKLVGGEITPDRYAVQRLPDGKLEVIARQQVEPHAQPLLSGEQVLAISTMTVALEQAMGLPVDVECCYARGTLYLLQCRPITTLHQEKLEDKAPSAPLFDTSTLAWDQPEDAEQTWSGGDIVLPLQQSLSLHYYQGWAKAFRAAHARGGLRARYVNGVEYRLWQYEPLISWEDTEAKNRQIERETPHRWQKEWLPAIQADLARWQQTDLPSLMDVELATHLQEMLSRQLFHWEIHAVMGSVPLSAVQRLVDWYLQRFDGAPESEPYQLLQGQVNTSLETNHLLWEASRLITEEVRAQLERGDWSSLPGALQAKLSEYWSRFGRVDETLRQRSATLLLHYAKTNIPDPLEATAQLAEARVRFTAHVRARLSAEERPHFEELLATALANNPLTEDHNLWLDQQSNAATRSVVDEFARRLVERKILAEMSDIEYLTLYELIQWGYGLADPLYVRVAKRKEEYAQYRQIRMPAHLGRAPEPSTWVDRFSGPALPLPSGTGEVRGVGASAGIVRARARVVRSLDEASTLQPGEVLVCTMTDPAWTPYFALAAALITDRGGSLCHAAVVAREYRLPAVVGTHTATQTIATGQMVQVDGANGIVRLLSA